MKEIKFKTSKCEFVVLDVDYNAMTFIRILDTATACLGSEELFDYKESFKLSDITEEQASIIVDENKIGIRKYLNYETGGIAYFNYAIESLHSLLKSKGVTDLSSKYIFKI